jgi:hypothetical protein
MGFDAAALVGGLDAWREEVGDAPPPRPATTPSAADQTV